LRLFDSTELVEEGYPNPYGEGVRAGHPWPWAFVVKILVGTAASLETLTLGDRSGEGPRQQPYRRPMSGVGPPALLTAMPVTANERIFGCTRRSRGEQAMSPAVGRPDGWGTLQAVPRGCTERMDGVRGYDAYPPLAVSRL
jgi:hypothetical protein